MNKSRIDWTDYSWNPITGCKHECTYCYARKQSKRFSGDIRLNKASGEGHYDSDKGLYTLDKPFVTRENRALNYPFGFEPTLHKYRFDWPSKVKNGRNIFVGSMTDMFGEWVPDEWIEMVFETCNQYPQHNYMFLTKNPKRYIQLAEKNMLPAADNFWYGSSTPTPDTEFFWHDQLNTFVSIEPILEPWPEVTPAEIVQKVKWVIIGAETGNRKGKVIPQREWIVSLVKQCIEAKVPVFLKDNLQEVMGKNFDLSSMQGFPEVLKHQRGVEGQSDSAWYKKMVGQCALCKEAKQKKEMIALLARGKRGSGAKQLAYVCRECYEELCDNLGVTPPELEF